MTNMMRPDRKTSPHDETRAELRPSKLGAPRTGSAGTSPPTQSKPDLTVRRRASGPRPESLPSGAPASAPKKERNPRGKEERGGPRKPKQARQMSETRIRNIAEHYVSQRECSRQMLVEVLERRLFRRVHGLDADQAEEERGRALPLIEAEVDRLVASGLIDDRRFAEMKARSWLASGRGARRIAMDLSRKGISGLDADLAIAAASRETTGIHNEDVDEEEVLVSAQWEAADTLARKKRIGKYRLHPMPEDYPSRARIWRREAAAMARAGFDVDLIRQILDQEPEADDFD